MKNIKIKRIMEGYIYPSMHVYLNQPVTEFHTDEKKLLIDCKIPPSVGAHAWLFTSSWLAVGAAAGVSSLFFSVVGLLILATVLAISFLRFSENPVLVAASLPLLKYKKVGNDCTSYS